MHAIATGAAATVFPTCLNALPISQSVTFWIDEGDDEVARAVASYLGELHGLPCVVRTATSPANGWPGSKWLQSNESGRTIALMPLSSAIRIHPAYAFYFGLPAPYSLSQQRHAKWLHNQQTRHLFARLNHRTGLTPLMSESPIIGRNGIISATEWLAGSGIAKPQNATVATSNSAPKILRLPFALTRDWLTAGRKERNELQNIAGQLNSILQPHLEIDERQTPAAAFEDRRNYHILKAIIADIATGSRISMSISDSYFTACRLADHTQDQRPA